MILQITSCHKYSIFNTKDSYFFCSIFQNLIFKNKNQKSKNTILHENIDVSNIPDLDADLEIIFEIICNKIQIFRSNSYIQPLTKQIKEIKILFNSKRKFKFLTPNKDKFLISIICFVNGIIAFINRLLLDNYDNIQTLLNKGDDEIQTYITTYFTQNVYDTFNYLNKNWTIAPVFTKIPSLNELHTFIKQFIVVEVVLAGVAGGRLNIINSNKYNENEKIIQNSSITNPTYWTSIYNPRYLDRTNKPLYDTVDIPNKCVDTSAYFDPNSDSNKYFEVMPLSVPSRINEEKYMDVSLPNTFS